MHGTRSQVAATGIGQLEVVELMHEGTEEHEDRTGATCSLLVDRLRGQPLRPDQFEVIPTTDPVHRDPDRDQDVTDPVHLLDARDAPQKLRHL